MRPSRSPCLVDRRQGDMPQGGDERVVVADERDVVGHRQPPASITSSSAERTQVVAGEHGRDPRADRTFRTGLGPRASVKAADRTTGFESVLAHRADRSRRCAAARRRVTTVDVPDVPVPEPDQVLDGDGAPSAVVVVDRVDRRSRIGRLTTTIGVDRARPARCSAGRAGPGEDDPVDAEVDERLECVALVVVVEERAVQQQPIAASVGGALDPVGDAGEVRVVEVVDQQPERARAACSPGGGRSDWADSRARRRPPTAVARRGADLGRITKGKADERTRHAGAASNVVHRRLRHVIPLRACVAALDSDSIETQ